MSATVREVVDDAIKIIGQVDGAGVQLYTDDIAFKYAIQVFNIIHKRIPWDQYTEWSEHTLDGTLGIVNADAFSYVADVEDFIAIHREDEPEPIPRFLSTHNPYRIAASGGKAQFWQSLPVTNANFATRRLQFWPKNATGVVQVKTRIYPIERGAVWDWSDTMHFDRDMLAFGTAWLILANDGTNPAAATTNQHLMDMRFADIRNQIAAQPLSVRGTSGIPMDWYTRS